MIKTIHITGASGFVGSRLKSVLSRNFVVKSSSRSKKLALIDENYLCVDWSIPSSAIKGIFTNVDAIIHCAGLAHETSDKSSYQLYYNANVTAAINAFVEAKRSGVRKFIFLSSLSVFDTSGASVVINDKSIPSPNNDYGKTKHIAELELTKLAENSNIELIIIRTPMVVGASAPGNLKSLVRMVKFPIPFPLIINPKKRSLITLNSLAEFCFLALSRDHDPGITAINLANTPAITLSDLVRGIREGSEVRNFRILLPKIVVLCTLYILGRKTLFNKIYGGLLVSPSVSAFEVGWEPRVNWEAELYEVGLKNRGVKGESD